MKKKVVVFFVISLTTLLAFCLFFFYNAARNEIEKENLTRMGSYCRFMERILVRDGLDGLLERLPDITELTVTIVNEDGTVLYDSSNAETERMDNRILRPEIKDASRDGTGNSIRYSNTRRAHMLYYALRAEYGQERHFLFIRTAMPLSSLSGTFSAFARYAVLAAALIAAAGFAFRIWLTKRLFRPLEEIVRHTEMVENGKARFPIFGDRELQRLSVALNTMSENLRKAKANIDKRRDELAQIVEALPIGVAVIGADRRVRYLNEVTRYLFGEKGDVVKGSPIELLIRSAEIYDMLDAAEDTCKTVFLPPNPARFDEKGTMAEVCAVTLGSGRMITLRKVDCGE
ncbi:MAG: HAMP domain-containing protein [Synergistaceae bacterium]|nr:HAMP domain-containing protein [Synergistaceae bacterium]